MNSSGRSPLWSRIAAAETRIGPGAGGGNRLAHERLPRPMVCLLRPAAKPAPWRESSTPAPKLLERTRPPRAKIKNTLTICCLLLGCQRLKAAAPENR